jgi:predicted kinase
MPRLELPDPALVLLVGPAGSGKSTFAAREFAPDEVVSSDELRGLIGRDEADQTVSRAAFAVLHRIVERRLAALTGAHNSESIGSA